MGTLYWQIISIIPDVLFQAKKKIIANLYYWPFIFILQFFAESTTSKMASDKAMVTGLTMLTLCLFIPYVVVSVLNTYTDEFNDVVLETVHQKVKLIMSLSFDVYTALMILCYVADALWIGYAISCICRQVWCHML